MDDLWKLFDFDSDGAITQEEYRRGCLAHPELISQLGLGRTWAPLCAPTAALAVQTDGGLLACTFLMIGKAEAASAKIGKRVLMGQHKWDFMLSVMIGIHVRLSVGSLTPQDL